MLLLESAFYQYQTAETVPCPECQEMSAHVFWLSLSFQHLGACVDDRSVAEMKLRRHKSSCRQVLDLPVLRESAQERSSGKILISAIGHFHPGSKPRHDFAGHVVRGAERDSVWSRSLPGAPSGGPKLYAEAWPHLPLSPPFLALFSISPRSPGAQRQPRQTDRRTVGLSAAAPARRRHRGALRHHGWSRCGGAAALGLRDERGCGWEKPAGRGTLPVYPCSSSSLFRVPNLCTRSEGTVTSRMLARRSPGGP